MNTNKTYVAFDAQGVYDHEHSNLHYHQQMREWQRQYPQRYAFLNMQDIDFSSMHEDLIDSTFKVRCLRQMAEADNLLVLASDLMNVESTTLNWQISRAVNRFRLPVASASARLRRPKDYEYRRRAQSTSYTRCGDSPSFPNQFHARASDNRLRRLYTVSKTAFRP